MEKNTIYHGECLTTMREYLPDASVDCLVTSPPYWQLRNYGWKGQWGMEPTYEQYLQNLWSLMDETWRVLKDTGTVFINMGDTYGTVNGKNESGIEYRHAKEAIHIKKPKTIHKCLLLLPHKFAIGCIERGWIVRNTIIWAKTNGMPESVTDRFSKRHEYLFFMTKQPSYYFDLDAIRDTHSETTQNRNKYGGNGYGDEHNLIIKPKKPGEYAHKNGKNPGDVCDFWKLSHKPLKTGHVATFSANLIEKPILAGCPPGGIVLDPFCGTGSTGIRALQLGRKFIGIEGSEKFAKLARALTSQVLYIQ